MAIPSEQPEWVKFQVDVVKALGLNPNEVSHITIDLDAVKGPVVTATLFELGYLPATIMRRYKLHPEEVDDG